LGNGVTGVQSLYGLHLRQLLMNASYSWVLIFNCQSITKTTDVPLWMVNW